MSAQYVTPYVKTNMNDTEIAKVGVGPAMKARRASSPIKRETDSTPARCTRWTLSFRAHPSSTRMAKTDLDRPMNSDKVRAAHRIQARPGLQSSEWHLVVCRAKCA